MIVIHRFTQGPAACSYLPERQSTTRYELAVSLSPAEYEERMNAGWRKFGALLFKPICSECHECVPIRIPVDRFLPDRSQKRAFKRNADLRIEFGKPTADEQRLGLYRRYHESQMVRKGWHENEGDLDSYRFRFVLNPLPAVEISLWDADTLLGVALTEVTPNVVSGIYHYHAPECLDRSLGTFLMLQSIALAQRLGKPYAYFGFYVAGCGSLSYKARFRPCEILGSDGNWRDLETLTPGPSPEASGEGRR